MAALAARQGRQLQRYTSDGHRLVVGCIPYRVKLGKGREACEDVIAVDQALEILVISCRRGQEILFPRGGWEEDESIEEAASREAMEEAGVRGNVQEELGKWWYESKSQDSRKRGIMFPLKVTEELLHWPEMGIRMRRWVSVAEVREFCQQPWMREALERLVASLSSFPTCSLRSIGVDVVEEDETQFHRVDHRLCWMNSVIDHIMDDKFPEDPAEVGRLIPRSARYTLVEYACREVDEDMCENYLSGKSLARVVIWRGYYWLTTFLIALVIVPIAMTSAKNLGINLVNLPVS